MYANKTIIQIGAHVGNTINDPIFADVDETTRIYLVEPVPYIFKQLQANYSKKLNTLSNVVFINKAVSNYVGEIIMNIPSERNDFDALPSWATQISSVYSDHIEQYINTHFPHMIVDTIKVNTTTINEIIREHDIKEIELLHTDTEGHDFAILMSYDFSIKPKTVMFEHKHMDGVCKTGNNYNLLILKLVSLGYVMKYQTHEDTVYSLPDE
jgi:FkbM family methyltransferase